jgi:regulator of sigma E protease
MISHIATNIFAAIIVLGIIVVIHELGHFLVAKFFKIRVDTFSIGFGPRLIGFRRGETDYRISAFPLGGYVRMGTEYPTDDSTGAAHEYLSKPKWQRFLVAAAGPAMNVALAVGLLTGLFMYGTEMPAFSEGDAIVGSVSPGSAAEAAGLRSGDRFVSMDGKERPNWEEVAARIVTNAGRTIAIAVSRDGKIIETSLTPVKQGRSDAGYVGIYPDRLETNVIDQIVPGSPAESAGLQPGDAIAAVNGVPIKTASDDAVKESIKSVPETQKIFSLTFVRNGKTHNIELSKMEKDGQQIVGIARFVTPMVTIQENFSGALHRSIDKNIEYGTLIFQVLGKLLTREVSMKSVDGPIGIAQVAGRSYEAGLAPLLMLMAMISLNLGVMNLLPIPILDGGVMLMLMVEGLMGRDLSIGMKERIVQFGFVFLVVLTAVVLYNDVLKLLPASVIGQ